MASAPINLKTKNALVDYLQDILSIRKNYSEFDAKLAAIDEAYYIAIKENEQTKFIDGKDVKTNKIAEGHLEVPLILASLQTKIATLVDIFLTGYPIFGVVTAPEYRHQLEALEALIHYYDTTGHWTQNFIRFLIQHSKYNTGVLFFEDAYEYEFNPDVAINSSFVLSEAGSPKSISYPSIYCPDMYSTFWDYRVTPSEVSAKGEYGGYTVPIPKTRLRALLSALKVAGKTTFNESDAFLSEPSGILFNSSKPRISAYVDKSTSEGQGFDYFAWLTNLSPKQTNRDHVYKDYYFLTKLFCRLEPEAINISSSSQNTPQIFEVWFVNNSVPVFIDKHFTPQNLLPVFVSDDADDWFDYAAKTEAEINMPYQDAASDLLNTRIATAKRLVSDRGIYDPALITPNDMNSSDPAAKIPLKNSNSRDPTEIERAYRPIPFDIRGADSLFTDIEFLRRSSQDSTGRNDFSQGMPRKGNRTLGEYNSLMARANNREAISPLKIETQIMHKVQLFVKFYIFTKATKTNLVNSRVKKLIEINPTELKNVVYAFRMATGLTDKSKVLNQELLSSAFQLLLQSEELQTRYKVEEVFSYILSLGNVPDMDQFIRTPEEIVQHMGERGARNRVENSSNG